MSTPACTCIDFDSFGHEPGCPFLAHISTTPNPASDTARQAAERINRMAASEEDLLSNGRLAIEIQTAIDDSTAALRRKVEEKTQQVAELTRERDEARRHMALARLEAGCPDDETLVIHCRELRASRDAALARAEAGEILLRRCGNTFRWLNERHGAQSARHRFDEIEAHLDAATGGTK